MRIGVDLMGSDRCPLELFQAAWEVYQSCGESFCFSILGTEEVLSQIGERYSLPVEVELVTCAQAILPDEPPAYACRRKPDATLLVGIRGIREGRWDALVTAGSSGSAIVGCAVELEPVEGCARPGLLARLPSKTGTVIALDVGGSVRLRPQHLIQFAELGVTHLRQMRECSRCRIGLLNIGMEPLKGTNSLQRAYRELQIHLGQRSDVEFVGNVEGSGVYGGAVDVLLTDGFTGNIFLKASEGVAGFILSELEGIVEPQVLEEVRMKVDYERSTGAIVAGVKGHVVKCHGYSSPQAFANGIRGVINFGARIYS